MSECIIWRGTKRNKKGYGQVVVSGKKCLAHRLAYCEANGVSIQDINGKVVMHTCDNPACVNPEHLELGTQDDNIKDRDAKGRQKSVSGSAHHKSKLTEEQVQKILLENGTRASLAQKYGVSPRTIYRIKTNQGWKNVERT